MFPDTCKYFAHKCKVCSPIFVSFVDGIYFKRCLMPGGTVCMPVLAYEDQLADELTKLQNHLKIQLEEDIARIFDESLHPDLEIVCGTLKIQTHSCILQARAKKFYSKLTTVLNLCIEKHAYDEVYSFLSDAYTECDIQYQEKQILNYFNKHLSTNLTVSLDLLPIESSLSDLLNGVNSLSNLPFTSEHSLEGYSKKKYKNLERQLNKDLELDHVLANALISRIETTVKGTREVSNKQNTQIPSLKEQLDISTVQINGSLHSKEKVFSNDVIFDSVISLNSLISDKHSSMSENRSGALTSNFDYISQTNEQYQSTMENNSMSDSGMESNGFLESNISASGHKDASLNDTILDGITSSSTILDEVTYSAYPSLSETNLHGAADKFPAAQMDMSGTPINKGSLAQKPCHVKSKEVSSKSSKEEKQRQNEEIVTLESSSVSSETGSWESVFPPKPIDKNNKKCSYIEHRQKHEDQNSTHITTSCFIDAASLVEPEYEEQVNDILPFDIRKPDVLKLSQPIPCSSSKIDASPGDWSETNGNDDSLEQGVKNELFSDQKNISPTIFEMTPISEDSCPHVFKNLSKQDSLNHANDRFPNPLTKTENKSSDPYFSQSDCNSSMLHTTENTGLTRMHRYNESSPIVSGGACVDDHLPQTKSVTESPLANRRIENTSKMLSAPAWVVDMSTTEPEYNQALVYNDVRDQTDEKIQINKSGIESDTSEKSSHKFFIDFKSLPDATSTKTFAHSENMTEKKNIFSMYIDLSDKSAVKDMPQMPQRLSNSLNVKKNDSKTKIPKSQKVSIVSQFSTNENPITAESSIVFEEFETLCSNPDISISEIINLASSNTSIKLEENKLEENNQKEIAAEKSDDLFVKLSDLDKPVSKPAEIFEEPEKIQADVRMTRSIPENDWENQVVTEMPRSIEVMSSFHSENALSLNRLFPHLRTELSKSMPGSLSGRLQFPTRTVTASSLDVHEQTHDAFELSSVQSSIRSVVDSCSTEESSQMSKFIGNCQSKLGQDLLRMFLEEIAPDVVVEVSGRRIKAHKCILSSRCQYFAGILSGGWVESAGNVIVLPPFSFNVVQFALCHIYSGVSTIPESVSIVELATLADMLGLEGLKEAIMLTLKAKYCHFFHKPCSVCIAGVLECFPLSSVYGLDDLYHKCMRWITKYFSKVWPTKAFATLPKELLEKCYQQHVVNLSSENLVDTVYGCGIIVWSLQKNRWAETVARLCRRLVNAAAHVAATRLLDVLRHIATLPAEAPPFAKQALDDCIAAAIEWAPPDQLCPSYAFLSGLVKDIRSQSYVKPDLITNGNSSKIAYHSCLMFTHASSWRLQCEGALVRSAPRIVSTQAFKDLPADLRKRLRDLGCIMYGTQASLAPSSVLDKKPRNKYKNNSKNTTELSRHIDIKIMKTSFIPYTAKPNRTHIDSTSETKRSGMQNPPKIRTTKAQEERARFNLLKNSQSHDRSKNKAFTRPVSKSSNVTSKTTKENDKKLTATNKIIMVSSTESSRNSSPIQARSLRSSRLKTHQPATNRAYTMSQDSLISSRPQTAEPSTDSLGEIQNGNKYATYTKSKPSTTTNKTSDNKLLHTQQIGDFKKLSKTRIPIFMGQNTNKTNNIDKCPIVSQKRAQEKASSDSGGKQSSQRVAANIKYRKTTERRALGSLMNTTKSNSAKIVPCVKNDQTKGKTSSAKTKSPVNNVKRDENVEPPDIAVMERSGTFLKDEPTFGDKITDLDINK